MTRQVVTTVFSLTMALGACGDNATGPDAHSADADNHDDLLEELRAVDGVLGVQERPTEQPGYRYFSIEFEQPVNHDVPEGQTFSQFLTLHHRAYEAPMVLATTGYANYMGDRRTEPTRLLQANQLVVEHRFFLPSRPDPADWDQLRIRQAAADHHRIVEAFAHLYPAAWVSTGASKGGMTSIFHRRFYPDDVAAVIAYVAPISFGAPDDGYQGFFDTVGTQSCRDNLHTYLRELLHRRASMESMAGIDADTEGYTFDIAGGLQVAFESEIRWFEWTYWQYSGEEFCAYIPSPSASDNELYQFFAWIDGIENASDDNLMWFLPFYFQTEIELGFPAYYPAFLDDLLLYEDTSLKDAYPEGFDLTYDPTAMTDIADWVASEGSELLLIYGEYDPWTAGAINLGDATDSFELTAPRGNHGSAIADLAPADQEIALNALEAWTGVTPSRAAARSDDAPRLPRYLRRPMGLAPR